MTNQLGAECSKKVDNFIKALCACIVMYEAASITVRSLAKRVPLTSSLNSSSPSNVGKLYSGTLDPFDDEGLCKCRTQVG